MAEPILISHMRRLVEKGRGEDHVQTWSPTTGKVGAGTTVRGFLIEYDEAMSESYDEGYSDARLDNAYDG